MVQNVEEGEWKKSKFPPVRFGIWTLDTRHVIGISKGVVAILTLTTQCTSPVQLYLHMGHSMSNQHKKWTTPLDFP